MSKKLNLKKFQSVDDAGAFAHGLTPAQILGAFEKGAREACDAKASASGIRAGRAPARKKTIKYVSKAGSWKILSAEAQKTWVRRRGVYVAVTVGGVSFQVSEAVVSRLLKAKAQKKAPAFKKSNSLTNRRPLPEIDLPNDVSKPERSAGL